MIAEALLLKLKKVLWPKRAATRTCFSNTAHQQKPTIPTLSTSAKKNGERPQRQDGFFLKEKTYYLF